MDYILTYDDSNELYHHGIKGMKWGIRRYQNYDGSYTQKGLDRYNKASEKYDQAKKRKKEAKAALKNDPYKTLQTRMEYNSAKRDAAVARNDMRKSYKKLKRDYAADKGKELYKEGHTITGNRFKRYTTTGASIALGYATNTLYRSGVISPAAAGLINIGNDAVWAHTMVKTWKEDKKLRAYYSH